MLNFGVLRYVCVYACTYVCMYVFMYVYVYACMYVFTYVCMHACIHTYTSICIYTYIAHMYVCSVCMYVHTYVCLWLRMFSFIKWLCSVYVRISAFMHSKLTLLYLQILLLVANPRGSYSLIDFTNDLKKVLHVGTRVTRMFMSP